MHITYRGINLIWVASLLITIFCVIYPRDFFELNYLLPGGFFILLFIFKRRVYYLSSSYLVFLLIFFQLIIRCLVLPLLLSLGMDFDHVYFSHNSDIVVFMLLSEMIVVFISFLFVKPVPNNLGISFFRKKGLISLIILLGIIYLSTRQYFLLKLNFAWDMSSYWLNHDVRETSELASGYDHLIFLFLRSLIIVFCLGVIFQNNTISTFWKWIFSLIIVLLNASVIEGSSRLSLIFTTVPAFLILIQMFPEYRNKMVVLGGVGLGVIILITSFIKFSTVDKEAGLEDVFNANILNAYFAGIGNMNVGVDAYEGSTKSNGFTYFYSDLLKNIPGIADFIDRDSRSTVLFNREIYGDTRPNSDQIIPVQISALFHFGYIFSFIYAFIFSVIAFFFERQGKLSSFAGEKYVFFTLAIVFSLFMMLNIGSILGRLFTTVLFVLLPFILIHKGIKGLSFLNPKK